MAEPLIIDSADKVPPPPPGRHPHTPISGAEFDRHHRHRGLPMQAWLLIIGIVVLFGGFALWRVNSFLDVFFSDHPWIGPALFWFVLVAGGSVVVVVVTAICFRVWGWAAQGQLVRSRLGVPVNVHSVLQTPYLVAEGQAVTLELEKARYSMFPNVSTLTGYKGEIGPSPAEASAPAPAQLAPPPPLPPETSELLHLLSIGHISRSGNSVLIGHEAATEPGARYGRPHYLSLDSNAVVAVAGAQQSGKSSFVRFVLSQLAIQPGDAPGLVICDPHGRVQARSLAVSCGPLAQAWLWAPAIEKSDILASIRKVRAVLDRRINGLDTSTHPIVLVIDEFTAQLADGGDHAAELTRHVRQFGLQYAKVGGRLLLIGQAWPSDLAGGTSMRNAINAAVIFATRRQEAAYLLSNMHEAKQAEALQPQTGDALYKAHWSAEVVRLRTPYVSRDDLAGVADRVRVPMPVHLPNEGQDPRKTALDKARAALAGKSTEEREAIVMRLAQARGHTRTGWQWTTDELQQISGLRNQRVCDLAAAARRTTVKVVA